MDRLPDEYFPTTLPNAIPALGPRSFHRPRVDSLATSIDTPISRRITDKSLLESLHRDTTIKIRAPTPGTARAPRMYPPPQPPSFPYVNVAPYRRKTAKPELCELTEDFIEDPEANMPDDIEDCRIIKRDLKKQRQHLVDEQQYPEAYKVHQNLMLIDAKIWELDHQENQMSTLRHSVTKHQEIELVVASYLKEWDKHYEEFLQTTQAELDQIEEENRQELEMFDQNIPTGLSIEFRKPSPKVLNLRSAEKRLAYTNQLGYALQLKQRARLIEQQEAERQYQKQMKIIKARRARLINSHKEKIKNFLAHANSMRLVMVTNRNKTVSGYLKRLNFLDSEIGEISQKIKMEPEDVCNSRLDEERAEFVKQEELASPIPHFQPGVAYTSIRKKNQEEKSRAQTTQSQKRKQRKAKSPRNQHSRSSKSTTNTSKTHTSCHSESSQHTDYPSQASQHSEHPSQASQHSEHPSQASQHSEHSDHSDHSSKSSHHSEHPSQASKHSEHPSQASQRPASEHPSRASQRPESEHPSRASQRSPRRIPSEASHHTSRDQSSRSSKSSKSHKTEKSHQSSPKQSEDQPVDDQPSKIDSVLNVGNDLMGPQPVEEDVQERYFEEEELDQQQLEEEDEKSHSSHSHSTSKSKSKSHTKSKTSQSHHSQVNEPQE